MLTRHAGSRRSSRLGLSILSVPQRAARWRFGTRSWAGLAESLRSCLGWLGLGADKALDGGGDRLECLFSSERCRGFGNGGHAWSFASSDIL